MAAEIWKMATFRARSPVFGGQCMRMRMYALILVILVFPWAWICAVILIIIVIVICVSVFVEQDMVSVIPAKLKGEVEVDGTYLSGRQSEKKMI